MNPLLHGCHVRPPGLYVAASLGLEPRQRDPESLVLPLHHEAKCGRNLSPDLQRAQAGRSETFRLGQNERRLPQGEFLAFARSFHFEVSLAFGRNFSRGFHHAIDCCVVVVGVVMKEHQLARAGIERQGNGRAEGAGAPADVSLIFFVGVLRIENQNIRSVQKFDEAGPLLLGSFSRLLRTEQMGFRRMSLKRVVWFGVRQESNRTAAGEEAISNANTRMIHEFRTHPHFADVKFHRLKFLDVDLSGKVVQFHRKKWAGHLSLENLVQFGVGPVVAVDSDLVLVIVGGNEKREPLDVIPMNVRDQQAELDRPRAKFVLQSDSELTNSRSRVQDNDLIIGAHLYASGVTAITNRARPRYWDGTAHAPEL